MVQSRFTALAALLLGASALAQPQSVEHTPSVQVFGEPAGVTGREPEVVREDEPADLWFRVSFSFQYANVALYYTTDGSEPQGGFGTGDGTTQVLTNLNGGVQFVRNENSGGQRDWWKARIPNGRAYAQTVRYKIGTYGGPNGGFQVFTNGANTSAAANTFSFANKLAWPGAGAGQPSPTAGYPPVSFWKEEAVIGNTYTAAQLDQNGTVYDMHFPTPGGVQGVGTRNEGYVDGLDTFPPGLPAAWRGQMHLNQAMPGIRLDGVTHWLSNPNGVSFDQVQQAYLPTSNTVVTSQRLVAGGSNIQVQQVDFSPAGGGFPTDAGGNPERHIYLKRLILTNPGPAARTVNVYWYMDPALNGGDGYDGMFTDPARGSMVAFDNAFRVVTGTGTGFSPPNEYNPTTSPGYEKNISLYLAAAMKTLPAVGAAGGTLAQDSWRDTSGDSGQGWIGQQVTLPPGVPVEVNFIMAGADDRFAGATGTYSFNLHAVLDWFASGSMQGVQLGTDAYWSAWLAGGVTIDTPDDAYDDLMNRSLLATALHVDGVNGGVIAGFHNGAYPYVWPRDAVYAAVTLARTGHTAEAAKVYDWMRDTCFRSFEGWGRKGFWKQKYTTDGYVVWGAPQIDETAVFPWGLWYQYLITGDAALLSTNLDAVKDSVLSMTQDSSDSRLRFEESVALMYSNNVWEDSYDTFIYSNANVARGLTDAASILSAVGDAPGAADALARRATIKGGLDARLDWDGENTDISQLGIVYPFGVYAADDFRAARVVDRINGVRRKFNGAHPTAEPLVNFAGEHAGTINRYWGDTYWNGGPWFLSTLWYGLYYADRQDHTPGTGDIDNHLSRLDLSLARLGPAGLGAEQIAYGTGPGASLLYPGQQDFKLQTAWPNAWESMSTLADSVMAFIDYAPNAPLNSMTFEPKLPAAWPTMTFRNLPVAAHRVDATIAREPGAEVHTFTNRTGAALSVTTTLRADLARCLGALTVNGDPVSYSADLATGRVTVGPIPLALGTNASTQVRLAYVTSGSTDFDGDGDQGTDADIEAFFAVIGGLPCPTGSCGSTDFDGDGDQGTDADIEAFFAAIGGAGC